MYKPLSQAWSEGEESEEDSQAIKNNLPQQPKATAQSMVSSLKTEFPAGTYSTAGGVESLYACSTAIPIESSPTKAEEVRPLTLKRKIALTISILNCIAFAVVFMWILPCDKDTCKAKPAAYEWKRSFPNLSFNGLSHHVKNNNNKTVVVASYEVQGSCEAVYCQGLLALDSRKGAELWKVTVPKPIRTVDCQLITSGDCLVSLKTGGLIAFNSHAGDLVWQMHQHAGDDSPGLVSDMDVSNVIALSDLNADTVNDLAVFSGSSLSFVSGKSGRILGNVVNFTDCLDLTSPVFNNTHIVLHCSQEERSIVQAIPLQNLYSATQSNSTVQWTVSVASTTSNNTNTLMVFGNYSVASQNQGNCPQCEAILILRKANITLFEKNWKQTFLQPLKSFSLQEGSLGMLFPLQTWACSDPTDLKWHKRDIMFLAVLEEYHVETEELNIQFTYPLVDVSVGSRGPQLFYGDGTTLNSHILTPDIEKFVENTA